MNINNIKCSIENFFQLKVECDASGKSLKYSFYLLKENQIVKKTKYSSNPYANFNLNESGIYTVKVYIKNNDNRISKSIKFRFNEMKNISYGSNENKNIIILGVSKASAMIDKILKDKYKIEYYVDTDESKIGHRFFERPIREVSSLTNTEHIVVVANRHDNSAMQILKDKNVKEYEIFDPSFLACNIVTKTMNEMGILQLYKLSRQLYLEGLEKEANYIKRFIYHKFNCIVPYTAELSDTVKFGYGGIGVVIHANAIIGENVKIAQNVTIGSRGDTPIIGNNVFIGPGSKCLGGKIGSNVVIGANSVITKPVDDNCVLAGVPAKIISTDIDKYENYLKK